MSDIKEMTLVGSLRAASVNRPIAALAAEMAPAGITVHLYQGRGDGALASSRSTTRTSTPPPTYPPRLTRCAAPSRKPTRSWW